MRIKGTLLYGLVLLSIASALPELKAQGNSPIQISIFNPLQIVNERTTIKGLRINLIYGKNRGMNGLDIGMINHIGNKASTAVQLGFANYTEANFKGVQFSVGANWGEKKVTGLQWGLLNYAINISGLQVGFVNYAENMNGLQIGLANIIKNDGAFPFFPFINWSF